MPVGDASLMKAMNRTLILSAIRRQTPISRTDVSRITGLNKSTVSVLTAELVEEGYVLEIGRGDSSGGRKPRLIAFNGMVGLVIGVKLSSEGIAGVMYNLLGEPLGSHEIGIPKPTCPKAVAKGVKELTDLLMAKAPRTNLGLLGVGVGIPGSVDAAKENVTVSANLGWKDVPIRGMLEEAIGHRVYIENEANAGALGEKWFGAGGRNLLYVHLDSGVGAGVIIDGQLYTGRRGMAGEVGHMAVEANGRECKCGNRGCWEQYVSVRRLWEALPGIGEDVAAAARLAEAGDEGAVALLGEIGAYLGVGLTSLMNIFDPDIVSLGGSLVDAGEWVLGPARQVVKARSLGEGGPCPVYMGVSPLGKDLPALGAACLLIEEHFGAVVTGDPSCGE